MLDIIKTNRFKFFCIDDNVVIFAYKDDLKEIDFNVNNIANNTENTWEAKRNKKEINKNTLQGKIVEELFIDLIEYENSKDANPRKLVYLAYDEFRVDLFKKHAPIDGLLYEKGNPIIYHAIDKINKSIISNNYGLVADEIIQFCRLQKIYMVEIKSSKIPWNVYSKVSGDKKKLKYQEKIIDELRKLDLFKYPKFNRTNGHFIHNTKDYLDWVKFNIPSMKEKDVKDIVSSEKKSTLDIYTRIFIDDEITNKEGKGLFLGYLLGYVLGFEFYENLKIMNFTSEKSGKAIYVTYPISKSTNFNNLFYDMRLWGNNSA